MSACAFGRWRTPSGSSSSIGEAMTSAVAAKQSPPRRRVGVRFTQSEITRAVQGVRRAGYEPRGVSIYPDGRISVQLTEDAPNGGDSWDDVLL